MWHSRRNTWDLDCWLEGWLWPMVTESLYSPQNLHICSQIFCTAALLILKETVLIGDPESYPLNNSKSRACLCRLWVWLCWGVMMRGWYHLSGYHYHQTWLLLSPDCPAFLDHSWVSANGFIGTGEVLDKSVYLGEDRVNIPAGHGKK